MDYAIKIQNLNKSYGPKTVLNNLSIEVKPGTVVGYIGPNGAGKSTTVKIMCGLLSDYEGDVFIKEFDVKKHPVEAKKIIGYIPELAELYDVLTPNEFLQAMGALYGVPQQVCTDRISKMMHAFGLQANVDQRMDSFSKGMKQKVLIISGLLHNPEIIILDEPLSGLDANSVIIVKQLITTLAQEGKTIFYCSHMMDIVEKISDRIILIDKGQVIAHGSMEEIRNQAGNKSLEQIFASLTSDESQATQAQDIANALNN